MPETMAAAAGAVRRKERIERVDSVLLPIVLKQGEIRGSLGGTKDELGTVLDLISPGKLKPALEEVPF